MTRGAAKDYSLRELVERFGGEALGDREVRVSQVAPLAAAQPHQLAFFALESYRAQLEATRAGAVILGREARDATRLPRIVCDNPHAYFARVCALFNPQPAATPGAHPQAVIDPTARVSPSACIAPLAVIDAGATIGAGAVIGPHCVIGEGAEIGAETRLHAGVSVYPRCRIGARCVLHAGAVIGSDGFGNVLEHGRWLKIPQIGAVAIGDDVEIGANTTIDRGALEDTVIEEGVRLDNQIQVGHNCFIGAHTAIAGCVGIAGSARIGRHCTIGGAAMILGHLSIADHVDISAGTLVTKSIREAGRYTGAYRFEPHKTWLRNAAQLHRLDQLAATLRELERRLAAIESDRAH